MKTTISNYWKTYREDKLFVLCSFAYDLEWEQAWFGFMNFVITIDWGKRD